MAKNKSSFNVDDGRNELMKIWKSRTDARVREVLYLLAQYTIDQMSKVPMGEWYTTTDKKGRTIEWQASASGQYPAIRSGDLIKELEKEENMVVEWDGYNVKAYLTTKDPDVAEYAIDILDEGLRPWRNRAFLECGPKINQILSEKLLSEVTAEMLAVTFKRRYQ